MKHVAMSAVFLLAFGAAFANPLPQGVPEQARPVYVYINSVLSDDLSSFRKAHSKVALGAYEQAGGISKLFDQVKTEIPKKFANAQLTDFTFTAEMQTHATPGSPLELDARIAPS